MTVTLQPWQREELERFADGEPKAPAARPNKNLIRRDLIRLAPEAGTGAYRITPAGLTALGKTNEGGHVMEIPDAVAIKLASMAVHVQEAAAPSGHPLDFEAAKGIARDPQVADWLGTLDPALLPLKR